MSERFQPIRGTRDFLPKDMISREYVIKKIKGVFELFGFSPIETPAIESWDILSAKGAGGSEVLEETYRFEDRSGRVLGLRYDLTVPLARVVANNPNIPLPFKRYQIEKVWRYGDVSKGRLREFLQADIDIVGSESLIADAEVIACAATALKELGIDFLIRLNSRRMLFSMIKVSKVEREKAMDAVRAIDKLEKLGEKMVKIEMREKGISESSISKIFDFIKSDFKELSIDGKDEMEELSKYLEMMGIKKDKFKIDLSLARGLDYYTGPIFEISAFKKSAQLGSIAGGGRYDKLIGLFLKKNIPATGISLGIERIIDAIKIDKERTKTRVFVANVDKELINEAIKIAQGLRRIGIATDFDLRKRSLSKQLEYANSLGIPFVVIVGKKELEKNEVTLRNMKSGEEKRIKIEEIKSFI